MNKSRTMRIDLIPEISDIPLSERPKASFGAIRQKREAGETSSKPENRHSVEYSELFENIYDAGIITNLRGRIRDVNRRAVDAFGFTAEDFRNRTIEDIVSGADDELIRTLHEHLQHERFVLLQAYCFRADGTTYPAEVAVSLLKLSTPHLSFFVRDITLRRQADEMLRTEHNALQNSLDSIVIIDMQSRIEYANPATAKMWGYPSSGELIGKTLGVLLLNQADGEKITSSLSGEHYMANGIALAKKKDNESFRVSINASCNRDSDGNVVGAVLSFHDLTDSDKVKTAESSAERYCSTLKMAASYFATMKCSINDLTVNIEKASLNDASNKDSNAGLTNVGDICKGLDSVFTECDDLIRKVLAEQPAETDPTIL